MTVKKLDEVCDFIAGLWTGKKPPYVNVGVIRNTNFQKDGKLNFSDVAQLDVEVRQFSTRQLRFGDILLEKSGGGPKQPVGRVCVFEEEGGLFSLSNFTSAIRVKEPSKLDYRYLHHFLQFLYVSGETEKIQTHSTGIRNLQLGSYREFKIPLPPLATQQKIVAKLDAIFAEIDTATAAAEANVKNAEALFQSYLSDVFERGGEGWIKARLKDVVCEVVTGPFGSSLHKSDYVESGIPVVNPQNLINGKIIPFEKTMVSQTTKERLKKYSLKVKDIVIARRGEMGRCGLVDSDTEGWLCGTGSMIIRLNDKANENFIFQLLQSDRVRTELERSSIGATMSNLNQSILLNIQFMLPPIEFQMKTLESIKDFSLKSVELSESYEKKANEYLSLRQSILRQAFNGELVKE